MKSTSWQLRVLGQVADVRRRRQELGVSTVGRPRASTWCGRVMLGGAAAMMLASPMTGVTHAGAVARSGVVPPSSRVDELTYAQWSARWWQWSLESRNNPANPNADPNPGNLSQPERVNCAAGQSGDVWFLAGATWAQPYSTTDRTCSIPAETYVFFPIIDAWNDNLNCPGQPPFTLTARQLASNVSQQTDAIVPGSMNLTIDGVSVAGLNDSTTKYRAAAGGFKYSLPSNNLLSIFCPGNHFPAGTSPPPPGAFANGVYIMLYPLAVGAHQLHWTASETNGPFGSANQDVTYTIHVRDGEVDSVRHRPTEAS